MEKKIKLKDFLQMEVVTFSTFHSLQYILSLFDFTRCMLLCTEIAIAF